MTAIGNGTSAMNGAIDRPEDEVGRALIVAQQVADQTLAEARVEAERIRAAARVDAEGIRVEARADAERLRAAARAEVMQLGEQVASLREHVGALEVQLTTARRATVPPATSVPAIAGPPPLIETQPDVIPKGRAPEAEAPAPVLPEAPHRRPPWWRAIPMEAILPIVAIVAVLLVMLALMG